MKTDTEIADECARVRAVFDKSGRVSDAGHGSISDSKTYLMALGATQALAWALDSKPELLTPFETMIAKYPVFPDGWADKKENK